MEDVLDVYSGDHDDGTVLVCVDETSKQQTKETCNASANPVNWRLRTKDTRIKLRPFYPLIQ